jgi:hypothetical protein
MTVEGMLREDLMLPLSLNLGCFGLRDCFSHLLRKVPVSNSLVFCAFAGYTLIPVRF